MQRRRWSRPEQRRRLDYSAGCRDHLKRRLRAQYADVVSGVKIAEVKENLRNAADVEVDGFEDLGLLVTQTSGFDSALRVLEAVATEGRDWIVRDEERKRRWARNWSR